MLIVDGSAKVFNTDEIFRGVLISAKHSTWSASVSGVVTGVSDKQIRVMYLPSIQNVRNHYLINMDEVERGEWEIRYSMDGLNDIIIYPDGSSGGE